jgi:hypothetical protein
MKKFLDLGSITIILVALFLIGYVALPQRSVHAANSGTPFNDFPIGQSRLISLTARPEALEDLTPREQLDQMRDWLLLTAVSASGMSAEDINQALFDLPPIRHGYMQPVANFEYGDTRSCYLGNGQVIALLPADNSDQRNERLARIADEQRKNLGEKPTKLVVFNYDLKLEDDPSRQTAMLTRRETVDASDLFASAAGYYEAKINTLTDLNGFMGQIDDLTYTSVKDGLTVGGRKIKGHPYRGIRVEEIAALYQSEAKIRGSRSAIRQKIDSFNSRWANRTYSTEAEKAELEREHSHEEITLKEELGEARRKGGFVDGSGFSLDPTYDYAKLAQKFDSSIAPVIRRILSGDALSDSLDTSADAIDPSGLGLTTVADNSIEEKIRRAREGLAQRDSDPLFELLGEIASRGERGKFLANLIQEAVDESYGYQAARYDGELQGTETGMVLFYTDLLAKLWAMNYQNNAPQRDIDEFRPMTALPVSSIYEREMEELSNTRLWFGSQDRGFQVTDKGQNMLFARTATRVYAASSNPLKPGVEAQPNAKSAAFLGWWDNHYEEIARFEPEYDRLNEIMKWSLVITWLNQQDQANKLIFLQNVPVEHGNWFRDWVKQRPLRYTAWDKIDFYDRGFNNSDTEVLPRLKSDTYRQFGKQRWLIGGVSLAKEETFAHRVALSAESDVAQAARRSNLNYAPGESTNSALKTFEGTTYRFNNPSAKEAITTVTAKPEAKLRGLYGEVANQPVERTIAQGNGGFTLGSRIGDVPSGDLAIGNATNGFRVGWVSRDVDAGVALGRRLSGSASPAKVLALDPNVEAAIALPGNGGYFVKLEGSQRWLKVKPEGASSSLESGYTARVGNFDARAQNYSLAWVKPEDVSNGVREGGTLRLRKVANTTDRYSMELGAPDLRGEAIAFQHEGTTVPGKFDRSTGDVSFNYDELPPAFRENPSELRRLVTEAKPTTGGTHQVAGALDKSGMIEQLRSGDYRPAVRELVEAPDAFKTRLDSHLRTGLAECRDMMLNEEYAMVGRQVDDLIRIYGPREELRLYKVVAELNMPWATRNALAKSVTEGNRATVMDEFTARLNDDLLLKQKGESVSLSLEGGDVVVSYHLQNSNSGVPFARDDAIGSKALIYVQDTPGLNNLDWQVSPGGTLDAAISGQFKARVIKLPRGGDIARFKPAVIFDQSEGIKFNAVSTGGIGGGFRQPRYLNGGGNPGGNGSGGGSFIPRIRTPFMVPCLDDDNQETRNDDDCDYEDKDTVIVIVRK